MEIEKFNTEKYSDNMKSYYIVSKIYDTCYNLKYFKKDGEENDDEDEKGNLEYNILVVNKKLLNIISEVNFIFILANTDNIKKTTRVGLLLNLQVYLDPNMEEDIIVFINEKTKEEYKLEIV